MKTQEQIEEKLRQLKIEQTKYNPRKFGKERGLDFHQEIMVLEWILETEIIKDKKPINEWFNMGFDVGYDRAKKELKNFIESLNPTKEEGIKEMFKGGSA